MKDKPKQMVLITLEDVGKNKASVRVRLFPPIEAAEDSAARLLELWERGSKSPAIRAYLACVYALTNNHTQREMAAALFDAINEKARAEKAQKQPTEQGKK